MKTIVLTGGGTAGHVTPNIALLPALKKNGWSVKYIGSKTGIEQDLIRDQGIEYYPISSGKLRRYFDLRNISDPFRVLAGCRQSVKILRELKADIVFSKGGFVSVPVAWAAKRLGIPVILHESDYTPGLANHMMKNYATNILTTFPETAQAVGIKGIHVGTPIRTELLSGDAAQGLRISGLNSSRPIILVTGGSSGAQAINEAVRGALCQLLPKFQVIHLCGKGNAGGLTQKGYYELEYAGQELPHLLAAASLIIARAGSNSIYEFLALKKPMLLIPLPLSASRGDQILNARSFEHQGFAHVLDQEQMTPDTLYSAVLSTFKDAERMKNAMKQASSSDGISGVMGVINAVYAKAQMHSTSK